MMIVKSINNSIANVTIDGVDAKIYPFAQRRNFPSNRFSSKLSTDQSLPITIEFSQPVSTVQIDILDSDSPGNQIQAFNAQGQLIDTDVAEYDSRPNVDNIDTIKVTSAPNELIKSVKLIPVNNGKEYVVYENLQIIRQNCLCYTVQLQVGASSGRVEYVPCGQTEEKSVNFTQPIAICSSTIPIVIRGILKASQTVCKTDDACIAPASETKPPPLKGNTPIVTNGNIKIKISPVATPAQTLKLDFPFITNVTPIEINLSDPIITTAFNFLSASLIQYVDVERSLKTLLNYGEDQQTVILNYRYGNLDDTGNRKLQLKLLQPIPAEISESKNVFISREVVKSVIDKVRVRFAPPIDETPYLRPMNMDVNVNVDSGRLLRNVTLNTLQLTSGSVGITDTAKNIKFDDSIFRQWYSSDFNSSELNIDFTDYNNFIFYSSAGLRLAAFKEKLRNIELLSTQQVQFKGTKFTGSTAYAGTTYIQQESARLSKQKEDIIRAFDRYEQYLYFTPSGSASPYTASAYYADEGYEYNSIGYWPKYSSGELYSISSSIASDWYTSQLAIAQRYDEFNVNNLINTIPTHIREDDESAAYITFISMIGHFFDIIKPYIDQYVNVYDREIDPNKGLSKDLVNEIAETFGFQMPAINSIYDLSDTILGTGNYEPRRDYTIETYKRLLHNLPFFAKAKGSRSALNALLRSLGITPQLITVRESGIASSGSFNTFEEYTTGIYCTGSNNTYLTLPLSASNRAPTSIQFSFRPEDKMSMTLLTGDSTWALHLVQHPEISTLAKIFLTSGSSNTRILTSSYFEAYTDLLTNVCIRNYSTYTDLTVYQTDNEDIVYEFSGDTVGGGTTFYTDWNSTQYLYVGGFGSRAIRNFSGIIDEVRLWKINLSDEVVLNTAFDPGSNAGDTYDDPSNNLLIQLSFNTYDSASQNLSSFTNESPYIGKNIFAPSLNLVTATNVSQSQMVRYSRTVRQTYPELGGPAYITNKVKVAAPSVFTAENINSNGVKQLSRTQSIVAPKDKPIQRGKNKVNISVSPTEIINQNIIRTLGIENINSTLGLPNDTYNLFATSLNTLKNHYAKYYYVTVNTNRFIRIMADASSILDQVLSYFIPSKATALNGIVIEPNLLDRVKIPAYKELRFYGKNSRRTTSAPGSITGSNADYGASFTGTSTIETLASNINGTYPTYELQAEDWYTDKLISQSIIPRKRVSIATRKNILSEYNTYEIQHEDWYNSILISQSLKQPRRVSINSSDNNVDGSYLVYDVQHEDWYNSTLISQSLKSKSSTKIDVSDPFASNYITYNTQHENWYTTRQIIDSGSNTRRSFVDMGTDQLNKFTYNSTNNGSPGSEPYYRLYPRKLFTYEIDQIRPGGITSIVAEGVRDIKPSADFTDVGVYTFFNSPSGIYYYRIIQKTPTYFRPINFAAATTWSYSTAYDIDDVVYQNVTTTDSNISDIIDTAKLGNGKYYVFKTRPSYTSSLDGTYYYLNNVPSYIPPSLDKTNWQPLRFERTQASEPRRIVYDTFVIPDPVLNNFKTTTVSIDRLIDTPARYLDAYTLPTLESGSYAIGELGVQNIAALFALQTNASEIRIRLYRTIASRDADINRQIFTLPTGSHGVLLDTTIATANILTNINPIVSLIAGETPPLGKLYYTINNLNALSTGEISLLLYYFAMQVEPRVPLGYLRKHYRFYRDNSTGIKRRNYLGCKNTIDTTIDGLPPVQIFISEGTDISVSATQTNEEIITGGGGTLNSA